MEIIKENGNRRTRYLFYIATDHVSSVTFILDSVYEETRITEDHKWVVVKSWSRAEHKNSYSIPAEIAMEAKEKLQIKFNTTITL